MNKGTTSSSRLICATTPFLKIETDEGIVGWGEPIVEGRAHTVEAAVQELADYLVGKRKHPLLIEDH